MLVAEIDPETIRNAFHRAVVGTEGRVIFLPGRVVKLYDCPRKRLMAHDQQELAARHGLGPLTFGMFDITIDNEYYYGYVSERVKVRKPKINKHRRICVDITYGKHKDEILRLRKKLIHIGISEYTVDDLHVYNIGWKDGKMICVDFGQSDDDSPF